MATTTAPPRTGDLRPQPTSAAGDVRTEGAAEAERFASLVGGGALALFGLARGSLGGLGLALLGGGLAYRGLSMHPNVYTTHGVRRSDAWGVHVDETASILRPPAELFAFWRNFENLPRFMHYLESVRTTQGNRSHWVARGPMDVRVEWDAEITEERPNETIAWRSLPGSAVHTQGRVRFRAAPGNRGTVVTVHMRYEPPGGKAGAALAWLFGRSAEQEVREDLRRFKRLTETGEIPTTRGQPSGRGREVWEQTGNMVVQHRFALNLGWFGLALGLAEALAPKAVARLVGVSGHHGLLRLMGVREIATGVGILTQPRPEPWLWGRVAGDALDLSLLTAALRSPGADRNRAAGATVAVVGVTAMDLLCSLKHSCVPADGGLPEGRRLQPQTGQVGSAAS